LIKWTEEFPDIEIVVTGHSYGAGIASVITFLLNKNKEIKNNIRGVLYACPPVFNEKVASKTCKMITSIVFGWDIVPNLSVSGIFKTVCIANQKDNSCSLNKIDKNNEKMFCCQVHVPGTIYWLTYDNFTKEVDKLYLISSKHPRLADIKIHERMEDDHSMTNYYIYLLTLLEKEYKRIKNQPNEEKKIIKKIIEKTEKKNILEKIEKKKKKEKKEKENILEKIKSMAPNRIEDIKLELGLYPKLEELRSILKEELENRNSTLSTEYLIWSVSVIKREKMEGKMMETNTIRKKWEERVTILENIELGMEEIILNEEEDLGMAYFPLELLERVREIRNEEMKK
jgi:hypothetical protein